MSRVVAIDHGTKRSGLAVTDPLRIIATTLDTVPANTIIDYLQRYLEKEEVEGFVVGMPVGLTGKATDGTAAAQDLVKALRKTFPDQWVETVDERFTSTMAHQTVLASGIGKKARRDKGQLDRISATILLQGWMERRSNGPSDRK